MKMFESSTVFIKAISRILKLIEKNPIFKALLKLCTTKNLFIEEGKTMKHYELNPSRNGVGVLFATKLSDQ